MPTSTTKELERTSLGEGSNGVVGKTNNERISLIWSCGLHPKLRDDNLPLTEKELD